MSEPRYSENFTVSEFACPCCGRSEMHPETMERLQALREEYGKPFSPVLGGGFRCQAYDRKAGTHTEGRAVDPGIAREDLYQVIGLAIKHGFTGIGVKQHGGRWQLHLDDAQPTDGRPRPRIWTYP